MGRRRGRLRKKKKEKIGIAFWMLVCGYLDLDLLRARALALAPDG